MVLVWLTDSLSSNNMLYTYAKLNLGIAVFDVILIWFWGYSISSVFAWILFSFDVVRVAIAYILFKGVPEKSVLKCQIFCIGEFCLLCLALISLFFKLPTIAYTIWTAIGVALRGYGIWIVGRFIITLKNELGESPPFPWNYFPGQVRGQVQNKTDVGPEMSPIKRKLYCCV